MRYELNIHASVLLTFPGLKPAVAVGGMDCEAVVEADCALAISAKASGHSMRATKVAMITIQKPPAKHKDEGSPSRQ